MVYLKSFVIAICFAVAGAGVGIATIYWHSQSPRLMTGAVVWALGGILVGAFVLARALAARGRD
jgi:hypothetical protein